jgi:hypothetical protein
MLVYEPGQFFLAHQDSEKDDTMIGTLVVTLPSAHTGGELVIKHGGQATAYRGSKSALSLVAFYSDCRHEVLPVKSGYRITLTYNLLLKGDTSGLVTGDDGCVRELARCLDEHFTTRVTSPYSRAGTDPPSRLVYLLDHEYTARGLSWSRLKGTDASRASLLRAAADKSGCETALALADIQETWSAHESEPGYGYRGWDDYAEDEESWEDEGDSAEYELQELIDSSVRLTRWMCTEGTWSEDISLAVSDAEVCATTRSADLQPYASEYEGYMGNYGNTMDRWYRRAALVVWPRGRGFTNRAEASPAWALDELGARAHAGDLTGAPCRSGDPRAVLGHRRACPETGELLREGAPDRQGTGRCGNRGDAAASVPRRKPQTRPRTAAGKAGQALWRAVGGQAAADVVRRPAVVGICRRPGPVRVARIAARPVQGIAGQGKPGHGDRSPSAGSLMGLARQDHPPVARDTVTQPPRQRGSATWGSRSPPSLQPPR